jgi:hypothetical protein
MMTATAKKSTRGGEKSMREGRGESRGRRVQAREDRGEERRGGWEKGGCGR